MRIVLSRQQGMDHSFFQENGERIPLPDPLWLNDQSGVVVDLRAGLYWFLQTTDMWIHVRYYVITDEYPVGSRETLETGITTEFSTQGLDASELRIRFEDEIKGTTKKMLQYPQSLVDAICGAVEKANREIPHVRS